MAQVGGAAAKRLQRKGYERIAAHLAPRGVWLEPLEEITDADSGGYAIRFRGETHVICGDGNDEDSWLNASVALFGIVNAQLAGQGVALSALNGGNDLSGVVLTPVEYAALCASIPRVQDRPYVMGRDAVDEGGSQDGLRIG